MGVPQQLLSARGTGKQPPKGLHSQHGSAPPCSSPPPRACPARHRTACRGSTRSARSTASRHPRRGRHRRGLRGPQSLAGCRPLLPRQDLTAPPFQAGDFVWCAFPERETGPPRPPPPGLHTGRQHGAGNKPLHRPVRFHDEPTVARRCLCRFASAPLTGKRPPPWDRRGLSSWICRDWPMGRSRPHGSRNSANPAPQSKATRQTAQNLDF